MLQSTLDYNYTGIYNERKLDNRLKSQIFRIYDCQNLLKSRQMEINLVKVYLCSIEWGKDHNKAKGTTSIIVLWTRNNTSPLYIRTETSNFELNRFESSFFLSCVLIKNTIHVVNENIYFSSKKSINSLC